MSNVLRNLAALPACVIRQDHQVDWHSAHEVLPKIYLSIYLSSVVAGAVVQTTAIALETHGECEALTESAVV